MTMIHFGKKAPKGFVEVGRSTHLGKGVWMMRIEPVKTEPTMTHPHADQGGK